MPGTVRPKPASGVLHHSLIRRSPDEYVIESSYKSLTGALMNLKIDASKTTKDGNQIDQGIAVDEEELGHGYKRVSTISRQDLGTSQAVAMMAAMSIQSASEGVSTIPSQRPIPQAERVLKPSLHRRRSKESCSRF